jgi:hypothetical protein
MARTKNPDTLLFQRRLKREEKIVLQAAGNGSAIAGFYECLAWYQHCYNLGLRPGMDHNYIGLVAGIAEMLPKDAEESHQEGQEAT